MGKNFNNRTRKKYPGDHIDTFGPEHVDFAPPSMFTREISRECDICGQMHPIDHLIRDGEYSICDLCIKTAHERDPNLTAGEFNFQRIFN